MNFFDWTYGTKSSTALAQDVSLEEHDSRFHPEGYKEGDACKLRETANREDALPVDNGSSQKAVSLLKNWLPGIKVVEDESADALQDSLYADVRMCILKRFYDNWQKTMDLFDAGKLAVEDSLGRKSTYTILPNPTPVIRDCFKRLGFEIPKVLKVKTTAMAIEKTTGEFHRLSAATVSHTHQVDKEMWRQFPLILDAPVMIFRSNTEPRGITMICPYKDKDVVRTKPNGRVIKKKDMFCQICLNYQPAGTFQSEPNDTIIASTVYGVDEDNLKPFLRNGLLMYVDETQLGNVSSEFGNLNLKSYIGKQQKIPNWWVGKVIEDKLRAMKPYEKSGKSRSELEEKVFPYSIRPGGMDKVTCRGDYKSECLGWMVPDNIVSKYGDLRREGEFVKMRKILDSVAEQKGFKHNAKKSRYEGKDENGKMLFKSDELQEWDGDGYEIPLEKRFDKKSADYRYKIIRKGDEPVGWYNRETGEVHLVKGKADAETVAHELGWHASFHSAEKHDPELYNKMREYAKNAPAGIKEAVLATYGNELTEDELLDEIGAQRFTEENLDVIKDEIARRDANGWFGKVKDGVKRVWNGFVSRIGLNRFDSSKIQDLTPEDGMRILAKAMVAGKTLDVSSLGEKRTE